MSWITVQAPDPSRLPLCWNSDAFSYKAAQLVIFRTGLVFTFKGGFLFYLCVGWSLFIYDIGRVTSERHDDPLGSQTNERHKREIGATYLVVLIGRAA